MIHYFACEEFRGKTCILATQLFYRWGDFLKFRRLEGRKGCGGTLTDLIDLITIDANMVSNEGTSRETMALAIHRIDCKDRFRTEHLLQSLQHRTSLLPRGNHKETSENFHAAHRGAVHHKSCSEQCPSRKKDPGSRNAFACRCTTGKDCLINVGAVLQAASTRTSKARNR